MIASSVPTKPYQIFLTQINKPYLKIHANTLRNILHICVPVT